MIAEKESKVESPKSDKIKEETQQVQAQEQAYEIFDKMQEVKVKSEATIKSDIELQRENFQRRLAQRANKKNAGKMGAKSRSTANFTLETASLPKPATKCKFDFSDQTCIDDDGTTPSSPLIKEEVAKSLQPSMSMAPSAQVRSKGLELTSGSGNKFNPTAIDFTKMHANIWGGDLMGKPKPKEDLAAHNQQQIQQLTDSIHAKMQKSDTKKAEFNFAELLGDIKFINDKKKDKAQQ